VPERLKQETTFDVLGDVLDSLRFRGSIFFRSDMAAPWGMSLTEVGSPRFHIMLSGECFIGSHGRDNVKVREADIVVLPNGGSHWIADRPGRALVKSSQAGRACELGNPLFQNGEITNRLMCGIVHVDQRVSHPIISALPQMMHFSMLDRSGPVWSVVNLIDHEMMDHQQGSSRVADRLTEILFLKLLNQYVKEHEEATGFLAALRDRRVSHALALIHKEPEFNWTLATLGERVGMSRATLVRHFREVVGIAPMAYITDWRMTKAHNLINYTATSFEQIAESTGFASPRTLSRAVQRQYGHTPSELRRQNISKE
jgi:AraC-like DNA-binding protein